MTDRLSDADLETLENEYCVNLPLTCEACRQSMTLMKVSHASLWFWQCAHGHTVPFDVLRDGDARIVALVEEVRAWREGTEPVVEITWQEPMHEPVKARLFTRRIGVPECICWTPCERRKGTGLKEQTK